MRRFLQVACVCAMLVAGLLAPAGATAAAQTPVAERGAVTDGESVIVTHAQGETTVPLNPEVVFSFDFASIDTLQALGVEVHGMPELNAGANPYATDDTEIIGSLFEPDYEAIAAAEPDLIIVAARSSVAYGDLSDIAPVIDLTFAGVSFIDDLTANTTILAEIFARQDEAAEILGSIETRVEALRTEAATAGSGMVVMTSGGQVTALAPQGAVGGRGALVYETLGIQPPVDDLEAATHGEPISFEFLLEHDPDWLFVIDRDAATGESDESPAERVLDNDIVRETTAWQNEHIVYLEAFDWYIIVGGGLDSTQRMLTELETAFGI